MGTEGIAQNLAELGRAGQERRQREGKEARRGEGRLAVDALQRVALVLAQPRLHVVPPRRASCAAEPSGSAQPRGPSREHTSHVLVRPPGCYASATPIWQLRRETHRRRKQQGGAQRIGAQESTKRQAMGSQPRVGHAPPGCPGRAPAAAAPRCEVSRLGPAPAAPPPRPSPGAACAGRGRFGSRGALFKPSAAAASSEARPTPNRSSLAGRHGALARAQPGEAREALRCAALDSSSWSSSRCSAASSRAAAEARPPAALPWTCGRAGRRQLVNFMQT